MEAAKANPSMIKVGPPACPPGWLPGCLPGSPPACPPAWLAWLPAPLAGWLAGAIGALCDLLCPFIATAHVLLALLTALHHSLYCTACPSLLVPRRPPGCTWLTPCLYCPTVYCRPPGCT